MDADGQQAGAAQAAPERSERRWAVVAHLSAFLLYVGLIGGVLGPLIVWLLFRAEMPFVDDQGRETLNFQLTIILSLFADVVLGGLGVATLHLGGYLLVFAAIAAAAGLIALHFVLTIVAAVQAGEGIRYRYPFCWRLITR